MHILELDSFKLSDAVKFHNRLNPKLWGRDEQMLPEIREKLLAIADDFREFLGIADLDVQDITVSGSNAAYAYTPHSDIDLHLVVKFPENNDVYQELFNAKKYQYNEEHNLAIGGIPVELYVQDADQPPVSQGEYSVKDNSWIQVPRRKRAKIDDTCVKSKVEDLDARIHDAIASGDVDRMSKLWAKIKDMRQSGLDEHGEFGCENIAFKILRTNGCIKELRDARTAARDRELSLAEQNKTKKPFVYGYRSVAEDATLSPDGVSPETKMFLSEKPVMSQDEIIRDFLNYVVEELSIGQVPKLRLKKDPAWSVRNKSFGRYDNATGELIVALGNRHIMDILRTLAHELVHRKQDETESMPADAGETGSDYENEANAKAGVLMRNYAELHPEYFQDAVAESASGYIPTKKQANDPRYAMALTVDIKPGQVGKEANKMALKTDKQGKPGLLIKSANLQESLARELELFEDEDLFEVKMTSKNLANLAKDIKGAKVGLEFEMIVPNVSNDEDNEQEPDYDQDQRVRDIDDAVSFFDDGDYNSHREIRRLREQMESDYFDWQSEQIDQDWQNNGFEYFTEYLDREEPFDPEDYRERAEDEIKAEFPDMPPESEGFEELVDEKLREINSEYYTETWEAQGRSYDNAYEEFSDEKRDEYSDSDWLDDRGIRYASDVQNEYSDIQWPYWSSVDGGEGDIESVALDFMNAMGMDTVAISSSYHGSYKKWVGNGWVSIGSNKPDDCFTIEPDGSLEGDNSSDTGLEFVSPPIPLEDIGTVMSKVQNWAGNYGAYTGDHNKTSIHTNISVPGYDLDKLDYLKAALLLGDEYVLREFDRIGNTYAAPAIEKVKALVKQNPDKAQQLLDKMKSQLNAEASKLIHSGQTNKFTSINTKDNRVEFRSPGGDYLSIIADNPQKMVDTINRMVVTLDAAMDPNKYKEEYQKKLYKVLTGQAGGREAKTGAKQEMKKDDKDLLNIFSRYAAGELPKAALKSFVRQAQLERSVAKGKDVGKMWWRVGLKSNPNYGIEVVGTTRAEAIQAAKDANTDLARYDAASDFTARPVRAFDEKPEQAAQQGGGLYKIFDTNGRLIAGDEYGSDRAALARAGVWAMQRNTDVVVKNAQGEEVGRVSASGEITPTAQQPAAQTNQGNWGIWMTGADRFANQPGSYSRGAEVPLYRFPTQAAADRWIEQQRAERPNMRTDIEVREIEPAEPIPGSTLDLQRQRAAAAQQPESEPPRYEMYRISDGRTVEANGMPIQFVALNPEDAERKLRIYAASHNLGAPELFAVRSVLQLPAQQTDVNPLRPTGPGPWEVANRNNNQVYYNPGHTQRAAAETEARTWLTQHGFNPAEFEVRTREGIPQANDAAQGGLIDVAGEQPTQAPQTLTRPGQGQQVFSGYWKVLDPAGEEVYRFNGAGNNQADANRLAANWLRNNGYNSADFDVLPVMGEAR